MTLTALALSCSLLVPPQGGGADAVLGRSPAAWAEELHGDWQRADRALRMLADHERNARRRADALKQPFVSSAAVLMPALQPALVKWLKHERTRDSALDLLGAFGRDGPGAIPALLELAGTDPQFRFLQQLGAYPEHAAVIGEGVGRVRRTAANVGIVIATFDRLGLDPVDLIAEDPRRIRDLDFRLATAEALLACRAEACRALGIAEALVGLDAAGTNAAAHRAACARLLGNSGPHRRLPDFGLRLLRWSTERTPLDNAEFWRQGLRTVFQSEYAAVAAEAVGAILEATGTLPDGRDKVDCVELACLCLSRFGSEAVPSLPALRQLAAKSGTPAETQMARAAANAVQAIESAAGIETSEAPVGPGSSVLPTIEVPRDAERDPARPAKSQPVGEAVEPAAGGEAVARGGVEAHDEATTFEPALLEALQAVLDHGAEGSPEPALRRYETLLFGGAVPDWAEALREPVLGDGPIAASTPGLADLLAAARERRQEAALFLPWLRPLATRQGAPFELLIAASEAAAFASPLRDPVFAAASMQLAEERLAELGEAARELAMRSLVDGERVFGSFEPAAAALPWLRDCLKRTAASLRFGGELRPGWLPLARLEHFEQTFAAAVRSAERDEIDAVAADWLRYQPGNPVPYLLRACAAASLPSKPAATVRRLADEFAERFAALPREGGDGPGQDRAMADLERYGVLPALRELGLETGSIDARFFAKNSNALLYVYPQRQNLDRKREKVAERVQDKRKAVTDTQGTIRKYEQNIAQLEQQARSAPRSSRSTFLTEAGYLKGLLQKEKKSLPRAEAAVREIEAELQQIDDCMRRMRNTTIR